MWGAYKCYVVVVLKMGANIHGCLIFMGAYFTIVEVYVLLHYFALLQVFHLVGY